MSPVIALDIDGVLRPFRNPEEGDIAVECVFRAGDYPTRFHHVPDWDESGEHRVTLHFSRLAVEWVRSLVERGIDVHWATTWQGWANTYFAEAFEFTLPVAVDGTDPVKWGDGSADWKASALARRFPDSPILWLDDNPPWYDRDGLLRRADVQFMHINQAHGITGAEIASVEAWLEKMA